MKRYFVAAIICASLLQGQVQTIPNTTFPAVRALINGNFSWLNANLAAKQPTITGAPGAWPTTFAPIVLTTGSGDPTADCAAPTTSNLAQYIDTTNADAWWCYATNSWKRLLSVTGVGPYGLTGGEGPAPATPVAGSQACYLSSVTHTQVCLDSSGNAYTMVPVSGGSPNKGTCWKADGKTLGYCSTALDATGACTCN